MGRKSFCLLVVLWAAGLGAASGRADTPVYEWKLPANFPRPRVPASNPMSEAKAELGRHLFYDALRPLPQRAR